MVRDELWAAAGMTPDGGCLCIECLEARLGRQLDRSDFTDASVNEMGGVRCGCAIACNEPGRHDFSAVAEQPAKQMTSGNRAGAFRNQRRGAGAL
jgi:hypothetical protein